LREYVERWAFKHPQPADFFRTVEDVSGEDLDWFWRGWFFGTGTYDVAVTGVTEGDGGTVITFENRGELVLPLVAEVTYEGGRTERLRLPVEAFFRTDEVSAGVTGGRVVSVTLDPDEMLPDVDRTNDAWTRWSPPAGPRFSLAQFVQARVVRGGLGGPPRLLVEGGEAFERRPLVAGAGEE